MIRFLKIWLGVLAFMTACGVIRIAALAVAWFQLVFLRDPVAQFISGALIISILASAGVYGMVGVVEGIYG